MADGKTCPKCAKDIGIWAVFSAGMPSRIICPHCRSRLVYDGAIAIFAIPFVVICICAVIAHEAIADLGVPRPGVYVALLFVMTWIPVELLLVLYLRENRTIRLADPDRKTR
jgi:hypothetical protein